MKTSVKLCRTASFASMLSSLYVKTFDISKIKLQITAHTFS